MKTPLKTVRLVMAMLSSMGAVALFPFSPAIAQNITTSPDGTGTIVNINGQTFNITGGTLSGDGANLFHSFSQFGLDANQIANFLSNPSIQNILGRVTGGNASIINGLIQVSGGNSNLYLINPSGIIFGNNAQLNVPGSFTATTATGISFGNNWFNATGTNNYATLIGSPNQFAFNTSQPGSIINTGNLSVSPGQNLNLITGNVVTTGNLNAPGGNINIVAVPGTSRLRISQPGMLLSLEVEAPQDSLGNPLPITPKDLPALLTEANISNIPTTSSSSTIIATGNLNTANNNGNGGNINLLADRVNASQASFNTIGINNTGTILTGFDYVFIDANLPEYQNLVAGATHGTSLRVIKVGENGVDAITNRLASVSIGRNLHIISDGGAGNFWLGTENINPYTLDKYSSSISQWSNALAANFDLFLYGCNVAVGDLGKQLVGQLSSLTGANVAASTTPTGAASRGGDWNLEYSTGQIKTGLAFQPQVLTGYDHLFASFNLVIDPGVNNAGAVTELLTAITTANSNGQADTISLFSGGIYTLSTASYTNIPLNPLGDSGIYFGGDGGNLTTVNGNNGTITRDGAAANFRIVLVDIGSKVTFNNLTLSNGRAIIGGGVRNNGGTVTFNHVTVSGNSATSNGGGIYNFAGTTTITNSIVSGNSATSDGGGIYSSGGITTVTLTNSTVSGNSATNGGGISNKNFSQVNLTNSIVSGNSANSNGGGIYNRYNSTIKLTNSTVSGNSATNGGGISNQFGSNCFIARLSSCQGGPGTIIMTNSIVSGNLAKLLGGGIYNNNSIISLTNSTVSGNSATNGGGIYNQGAFSNLTLTNSIVSGNLSNNIAPVTTTSFQPNSEIARATQRIYTPGALGCGGGDTSALGNVIGGAVPAVAAIMNSGGGSVSISMGGAFPSCGEGMAALPGNQSQLAEYLYRQVQQKIGNEYRHLVHVSFSNSPGKATAIIQVDKAAQPAFLNQEGKQVFYIRDREGQRILSPTEQEEYIRRNWQL
jgi:filamentous hemagglutinin family protein